MTGFWLISYIVLWLIVIASGLTIMVLAREMEALHKNLDALQSSLEKQDIATRSYKE